jgi:hypothetical protein
MLVAQGALELHHQFLAQALLMLEVEEVEFLRLVVRVVRVALAVVAQAQAALRLAQTALPILAVVVVVTETPALTAAQAVQALSSFHTQAQHNYLVVELLPNQAVTSFTHSHLLAHLALCHL